VPGSWSDPRRTSGAEKESKVPTAPKLTDPLTRSASVALKRSTFDGIQPRRSRKPHDGTVKLDPAVTPVGRKEEMTDRGTWIVLGAIVVLVIVILVIDAGGWLSNTCPCKI
jgi:hypothetical protein